MLLRVDELSVEYSQSGPLGRKALPVRAVDHVSFSINEGEVVGLVGESGCGKSSIARALVGLVDRSGGRIEYRSQLLDNRQVLSGPHGIQMVFQDPQESLNPRKNAKSVLETVLKVSGLARPDIQSQTLELLAQVGLRPPRSYLMRYPHQLSGGQRQRLGIARALATRPDLIVADEAVSALDASVRAEILQLIMRLRGDLGLSYLFISHDLGVVRAVADRVLVMYLGQIVESGPTREVMSDPKHPYTRALIDATPSTRRRGEDSSAEVVLEGDVPSPANPPSGCRFRTRCVFARDKCQVDPPSQAIGPDRVSVCHFVEELFPEQGTR